MLGATYRSWRDCSSCRRGRRWRYYNPWRYQFYLSQNPSVRHSSSTKYWITRRTPPWLGTMGCLVALLSLWFQRNGLLRLLYIFGHEGVLLANKTRFFQVFWQTRPLHARRARRAKKRPMLLDELLANGGALILRYRSLFGLLGRARRHQQARQRERQRLHISHPFFLSVGPSFLFL